MNLYARSITILPSPHFIRGSFTEDVVTGTTVVTGHRSAWVRWTSKAGRMEACSSAMITLVDGAKVWTRGRLKIKSRHWPLIEVVGTVFDSFDALKNSYAPAAFTIFQDTLKAQMIKVGVVAEKNGGNLFIYGDPDPERKMRQLVNIIQHNMDVKAGRIEDVQLSIKGLTKNCITISGDRVKSARK